MMSTRIRDLKNKLSHYVRQIEAGKRVAVTAHGRIVAELVAAGVVVPAIEDGEGLPEWPDICLSRGTVAELIDSDRGELR